MKSNETLTRTEAPISLGVTCLSSCRKLLAQVAEVKRAIVREFEARLGHNPMVQAAVNEAEALAWQTPYPHLFFPTLAQEKAAAASQWVIRQQRIWPTVRLDLAA